MILCLATTLQKLVIILCNCVLRNKLTTDNLLPVTVTQSRRTCRGDHAWVNSPTPMGNEVRGVVLQMTDYAMQETRKPCNDDTNDNNTRATSDNYNDDDDKTNDYEPVLLLVLRSISSRNCPGPLFTPLPGRGFSGFSHSFRICLYVWVTMQAHVLSFFTRKTNEKNRHWIRAANTGKRQTSDEHKQ